MQTRLIRLASEEWCLPIEKIVELFKRFNVLEYIEKGYEIHYLCINCTNTVMQRYFFENIYRGAGYRDR
mgnify:CR=1 FL=1